MAHARAKLTPYGRRLLSIGCRCSGGRPRRWRAPPAFPGPPATSGCIGSGSKGPPDSRTLQPTAPLPSYALTRRAQREILGTRRRSKRAPHGQAVELGLPRSTIYGVLHRHGVSRLSHIDPPSGILVRFERAHPGDVRLYRSSEERLGALPAWIDFYNSSRPHIAVGDHPPMARLSTT